MEPVEGLFTFVDALSQLLAALREDAVPGDLPSFSKDILTMAAHFLSPPSRLRRHSSMRERFFSAK